MSSKEEKDKVTVGQIRNRLNLVLEDQLNKLCNLIREGYFKLPQAETFIKEDIAKTLSTLQNIDAMASTEVIFPPKK